MYRIQITMFLSVSILRIYPIIWINELKWILIQGISNDIYHAQRAT